MGTILEAVAEVTVEVGKAVARSVIENPDVAKTVIETIGGVMAIAIVSSEVVNNSKIASSTKYIT